jgi:hypothetical protein
MCFFGQPPPPGIIEGPAPPTPDNAETIASKSEAARRARIVLANAAGRSSTIQNIGGAKGLSDDAEVSRSQLKTFG